MRHYLYLVAALLVLSVNLARAEDVDAGKTLYVNNCQKCHGAKAQGGVGAKLAGDATKWEFSAFKNAVLNGVDDENKKLKKPMPLFGTVGLTNPQGKIPEDTDLENIFAYIKTFAKK
jgi:mono/diheme cytochrome c family protein